PFTPIPLVRRAARGPLRDRLTTAAVSRGSAPRGSRAPGRRCGRHPRPAPPDGPPTPPPPPPAAVRATTDPPRPSTTAATTVAARSAASGRGCPPPGR